MLQICNTFNKPQDKSQENVTSTEKLKYTSTYFLFLSLARRFSSVLSALDALVTSPSALIA